MGGMGEVRGREVQEGGDICILMADSGFPGGDSGPRTCLPKQETKEMWV